MTILARDSYGLSTSATIELPPLPLKPVVSVEPGEVEVKVGEGITAEVIGETIEGREISLKKLSGPGDFPTITGIGSATGTYTWTAEGYEPWRVVVFEATDQCGASSRAYLVVHVLQPPRVTLIGKHITVRPCGGPVEAHITGWVVDPDNPVEELRFVPRNTETISLEGSIRAQPWSPHVGVIDITVRVDPSAEPKDHKVPFTVADPDGMEASGTVLPGMMGVA